jgi:hypothetical protein
MHILVLLPAYLDPGSGSFILQLLVATLFGALVIVRAYWSKIKAFFRREKPSEPPQDQPQNPDGQS